MSDRKKIMEILKNRKIGKDQFLILLLAGVLLLVIAFPAGKGKEAEEAETDSRTAAVQTSDPGQEYAARMERELEMLLSQMEGVGDASVMITLRESAEKVVEKDVESSDEDVGETDSQGGNRTTKNRTRAETTVYTGESRSVYTGQTDSGSGQEPYVSKELTPRVEGVVVVAQGGGDAVTIKNITEAVQALFGIDTHKIRIVKKE